MQKDGGFFLFCVILIIFGIIVRGIDICLITNFCWKTSSILSHFRTILKKLQIYAYSSLRMRKIVLSKLKKIRKKDKLKDKRCVVEKLLKIFVNGLNVMFRKMYKVFSEYLQGVWIIYHIFYCYVLVCTEEFWNNIIITKD